MKNKISSFCLAALFFFLLFQMISIGNITSGSMAPNLETENKVIINRLSYVVKEPSRGDIIAFEKEGQKIIKRIVGVAGDKIESTDGSLIINGYVLEESYIDANMETNFSETFEVPEGCYFVLGDCREESIDSRFWEEPFITDDEIIGRVVYVMDDIRGRNVPRFEISAKK